MKIIDYIHDMKVKEFRHKRKIYDIPEDFHTNPKYKVYEELIPFYIKQEPSLVDSFINTFTNITKSVLIEYLSYKFPKYKNTIITITKSFK